MSVTQATKAKVKNIAAIVTCAALVLILFGAALAQWAHTSGGKVQIEDIRFVTEDGGYLRALLYIPESASPDAKAPAVVSCHGYNNTAEVQDLNCVELSKRGYVVMAIDAYGHGHSKFPDTQINGGIVADMGTYAALQYLKTLPYVDLERVGMTGHSMGSAAIQDGAFRAFEAQKEDPGVVVPAAILPTANSFNLDADGELLLKDYPVNLGAVYGQYDEWALGMWGTVKGSDLNTTPKAIAGMGFTGCEYDTYYRFGENTPIDRAQAVEAAKAKELRIVYQPPHDHPMMHFSSEAVGDVVDFFDITLTGGTGTPASEQTWFIKQLGTGLAMLGFFVFIGAFGMLLLKAPFFQTIVREEPQGLTTVKTAKDRVRYWLIYIIGLLPAPLLYNWFVGYSIDITAQGRTVPIMLPASNVLPMPCVNGIFLLNIVTGLIALALYLAVFFTVSRKLGCTAENMGFRLPGKQIFKAALLAVAVFSAGYLLLVLCEQFFGVDFRFFTLSIKTLTAAKWPIYLRYLPSFLIFFLITSMTLNTFTRVNNYKEWVNVLLITFSSFGGLLVLHLIDYISLKHTGVKVFQFIPFTTDTTAALAGVLLWGLLFILPVAAILSRLYFKKTGSIWAGGFVNALVVTLFAISNTVVSAYVL